MWGSVDQRPRCLPWGVEDPEWPEEHERAEEPGLAEQAGLVEMFGSPLCPSFYVSSDEEEWCSKPW
jgi:hypothetical protein